MRVEWNDLPHEALRPGLRLHGFEIVRVTPLPSLRCTAVEAVHGRSGCRFLHLLAADPENMFAVAFRTPPPDNTGVPHILEHSVLGGSRKYPIKDPFAEMVKTSMATFLNAMTYPDRTVYPVSSNVRQDFFNLVDVYCDAVFQPLITPETFMQEGHHLAFAEPGNTASPLVIKGIVYNEMKGAYSDLDALIGRTSFHTMFPDSPYGLDSGGDPEFIPQLTFADFTGFYKTLYHPANSRIFAYGDISTPSYLDFLDRRLAGFELPPAGAALWPRQPRWAAPREMEEKYHVEAGEKTERKAAVTLNWIVGDLADPLADLEMEVIQKLLLGNAAAPLRKALIESRLGQDLTGSGYDNGNFETTFHVGLKGTDPDKRDDISALIMQVLREAADNGFPTERVEAAFQQLQYSHREISANYPLRLMDWVYNTWIYDLDPLSYLHGGRLLDELQEKYRADNSIFSRVIRRRLLDNPHRLTVLFRPAPGLLEAKEAEFEARQRARRAGLAATEAAAIDAADRRLQELQERPADPAALAALPRLELADVPAAPKVIPADCAETPPGRLRVWPRVFANGINYLTLAFDLRGLPAEHWQALPLFADLFTRIGIAGSSYAEMAERSSACTGGVGCSLMPLADYAEPGLDRAYFTMTMKTLDPSLPAALDLCRDFLLGFEARDEARILDVLNQENMFKRSCIIPDGHHFAMLHAARHISPLASLGHLWHGLPQLRLNERLAEDFAGAKDGFAAQLRAIHAFLLNRNRISAAFTGDEDACRRAAGWLDELDAALPAAAVVGPHLHAPALEGVGRDGLAVATDVSFCAQCVPAPHAADPRAPALMVLARLLSMDYLWEEVRVKGGAYGGSCAYNGSSRLLGFTSYRDPEIERTLDIFAAARDYLLRAPWSQSDIEQAIIGCAKHDERPIRPGSAVSAALWQRLSRVSEDDRRRFRSRLLRVRLEDVKKIGLELLDSACIPGVCVLSGGKKLEAANRRLAAPLRITEVYPEAR